MGCVYEFLYFCSYEEQVYSIFFQSQNYTSMETSTIEQPISIRLKETTRPQHDAIEANSSLENVTSKDLSKEHYIDILKKFYGFHKSVEKVMEQFPEWAAVNEDFGFDITARRKFNDLVTDLKYLGVSDEEIQALPVVADFPDCMPEMKTFGHVLGCVYVLEGSTLGGSIISRHLNESLGVDAENGAKYYNSYGGAIGKMWKQTKAMLDGYAEKNPHHADDMVEAAQQVFARLDAWMKR
jgi:heme oxygenase